MPATDSTVQALYDALYQTLPVVKTMLTQYSAWGAVSSEEVRVLRGIIRQANAAMKKAEASK